MFDVFVTFVVFNCSSTFSQKKKNLTLFPVVSTFFQVFTWCFEFFELKRFSFVALPFSFSEKNPEFFF